MDRIVNFRTTRECTAMHEAEVASRARERRPAPKRAPRAKHGQRLREALARLRGYIPGVWVSLARLAKALGWPPSVARGALARLAAKGLAEADGDGNWRATPQGGAT